MTHYNLGDFEFDLPDGWSTRLLTIQAPRGEVGYNQANFPLHVVLDLKGFGPGQDFKAWAKTQLDELKASLNGFKRVGRETREIDGQQGIVYEFTHLSPDGQMVRQLLLFIECGDKKGLAATGAHLMGPLFDTARPDILAFFDSLKLTS